MMEAGIIVVITLCAVLIIPWMIRRDFDKRMSAALGKEIQNNINLLQEYINSIPVSHGAAENYGQELENDRLPVLNDQTFRKMQMQDFCPKSLSSEDIDMLEKVFTTSSQHFLHALRHDREKICTSNLKVLQEIFQKIAGKSEDAEIT